MFSINDKFTEILRKKVLPRLCASSLPNMNFNGQIQGLRKSIEIIRDGFGIPHIYAQGMEDLFFAQGFVHAQDRLWQMELSRRIACGRLSEVFGKVSLDTDRATRTFGFHRLANQDYEDLDHETLEVVKSYAAGVNAYLHQESFRRPPEFILLGLQITDWQPQEVLAISRLMAWQLTHAWYDSWVRSLLVQEVGEEAAKEWEIQPWPGALPTLPKGMEMNGLHEKSFVGKGASFLERGQGSNSWVLSAQNTITGKPILANDVHLNIRLPSVWYENHLICDELEATGASSPGLPMVLIGHNRRIAWGVTVAYTDCEDIFVEKFSSENPLAYEFEGKWQTALRQEETIPIKGQNPHIEEVIVTRHGPVISNFMDMKKQKIALQSKALKTASSIPGWLQLNKASNWQEFVKAMDQVLCPHLNFTYADQDGNIGYRLAGKVPIRKQGHGMLPALGWTGQGEWTGEVPCQEMPQCLNPDQGFLVTCNHKIISDDYPHFLGNIWANGFRAARITDLIEAKGKCSLQDCGAMQMDFLTLAGLEFKKILEDFQSTDASLQNLVDMLRTWDGSMSTETVGGTLYEVLRYSCLRNLLEDVLGADLTRRLMGQGWHPMLSAKNEFYGHDTLNLIRILENPKSFWLNKCGGKNALLEKSLVQTKAWLETKLGKNPQNWQWGKIHQISFSHALGAKKWLNRIFSRGPFPIGGDADTPCQTAILVENPYDNRSFSPTYRQIIDLGDFSKSIAMHAPGQSGHLASKHYDDLIEPWRNGHFHPMLWKRAEIEREAETKLTLNPS